MSKRYKGTSYLSMDGYWFARKRYNGKLIHLGHFKTEEEAARMYDRAEHILMGRNAKPNFPDKEQLSLPERIAVHRMIARAGVMPGEKP